MPHDGTNGASTLWSEADTLEPFAPPKRATPSRRAGSAEHGAWVDAFASSSSLDFEDEGDGEFEGASAWEERGGDFESESDYETERENPTSESYDFEDDESLSTPGAATCRCPRCDCEHEAFGGDLNEVDAEHEGRHDLEFGGTAEDAEWESSEEACTDCDVELLEEQPFESETQALPAAIAEGAAQLGEEWAQRRNGSPSREEMIKWLVQDYRDTIAGARQRFGKKYSDVAMGKAWLVSRREQMQFQLSSPAGIEPLRNFEPPTQRVPLVSSPSIVGSAKAPVAPLMVQFVQELRERYRGRLRVTTYGDHGGGKFNNRGYSLDLWLDGSEERGFYPRETAVKFLRALNEAARAVGAEWRVLYNDFSVADTVNRETGKRHVVFMGRVRKEGNQISGLNWHGPDPFILHLHLDLAPRTGAGSISTTGTSSTGSSMAGSPPAAGSGSVASLLGTIADRFRFLIQTGQDVLAITEAARSGRTDVNQLTNLVFFARHPELGGRKLRADERELAQEWLRIRDTLVQPILARLKPGAPATTTPKAPDVGSSSAKKGSVNEAVVARIKQYAPLVQAAAQKHGVEAALINGFIAAESGGNPSLIAKSGYTGLMQSDKLRSHLVPATSIDEGAKKLASFRKIMDGILRKRGHTYDGMSDVDQVHLLALAYNAGPVTVAKALQYAAEAGRPAAWREADHYKRALLFTGAYSTAQAAGQCLPNATKAERTSRIHEAEAVRKKHRFKKEWRTAPDPQAWATVGPTLPAFVQCAIDFKHRNSPRYAAKILAYRDRFRAG